MAYTKTNWVNGTTPLNQTNMNKIENELESLDTQVGNIKQVEYVNITDYISEEEESIIVPDSIITKMNNGAIPYRVIDGISYTKNQYFTLSYQKDTTKYYHSIELTIDGSENDVMNIQEMSLDTTNKLIYLTKEWGFNPDNS